MSWQEFVDDHLMVELPNGGTLQSAAIVGSEGDVWAQSSEFPELTTAEAHALQKGYTDAGGLAVLIVQCLQYQTDYCCL